MVVTVMLEGDVAMQDLAQRGGGAGAWLRRGTNSPFSLLGVPPPSHSIGGLNLEGGVGLVGGLCNPDGLT